jgi:hypothetical protein
MPQQHSGFHIAFVGFTKAEIQITRDCLQGEVELSNFEDAYSFSHPRHKNSYDLLSGIILRANSQDAFLRECSAVYFLRRMGYWMPVVMMTTLPYDGLAELGDSGVIVSFRSNEFDILDTLGEAVRMIISLNKSRLRSGFSDSQQHRECHDLEKFGDDVAYKCLEYFLTDSTSSVSADGVWCGLSQFITQKDLALIKVLSAGDVLKAASKKLHMSIRTLQIKRVELFSRFEVSDITALVCKLVLLVRAASKVDSEENKGVLTPFLPPPHTHTHHHPRQTRPDCHIGDTGNTNDRLDHFFVNSNANTSCAAHFICC